MVQARDPYRPLAEAVVTVTVASRKSCSSGPRTVSTVWIRDMGAIRHSCQKNPVRTYTASSVISQRCVRNHHRGKRTAVAVPAAARTAAGSSSQKRAGSISTPSTTSGTTGTAVSSSHWARHQPTARSFSVLRGGRSTTAVPSPVASAQRPRRVR